MPDTLRNDDRYFYLARFLDAVYQSELDRKARCECALEPTECIPEDSRNEAHSELKIWARVFVSVAVFLRRSILAARSICSFVALLIICAFGTKNGTVIFNHSSRVRKSKLGYESLYLSSMPKLGSALIFEDASVVLRYSPGVRSVRASSVAIVSRILSALTCVRSARSDDKDRRDIRVFLIECALWKLIFTLLKPSKIAVYVWYGKQAIVAAARMLSIEVSDIQHGVVYPSHPFYDRRSQPGFPQNGCLLPSQVLVYGEYWRAKLIQAGWRPDEVAVLGYTLNVAPKCSALVGRQYLLYTDQPGNSGVICRHIRSIGEEAARRGFSIVIARHPMGGRGDYADLHSPNVLIPENIDSYDLLRGCSVHISVSSTLLWESIYFNKSSYILDGGGSAKDAILDILRFGFARPLLDGQFPEPFDLPTNPPKGYFFSPEFNVDLLGLE